MFRLTGRQALNSPVATKLTMVPKSKGDYKVIFPPSLLTVKVLFTVYDKSLKLLKVIICQNLKKKAKTFP